MAEPGVDGAHHAARHRGGGAQSPHAHQGIRSFGKTQETCATPHNGGFMRKLLWILALVPALAWGQYPNKAIRMIVPFAPGGASDFVGRILQPRMTELLGQQIVVENRAGASGNIGMDAAAKAAPDGYTLYLGNVGTVALNPSVFPKLGVVPTKDFIAITQVVDVP